MDQFHQPAHQRQRLDAQPILVAHGGQQRGGIARQQQPQQTTHRPAIRQAQHVAHLRRRHDRLALSHLRMGDRLVEDGQPIARRPFGRLRDQRQGIRLGRDLFGLHHMGEMAGQQIGRNAPQVEPLATRQDGDRHLVHFGRREQEFHMRRRLLQRLQQRVEGVFGQHMHFVDNVDLVARGDSGIAHRLDNLAHVIDAGVARRVHLDHVDMPPLGNRGAGFADPARVDRRPALPVRADAVERLGDQPRGRCLADPAHARHQKGMGQPPAPDRIAQRLDHRILPDQLMKTARSIFAREDAIGLRGIGHCCGLAVRAAIVEAG